MPRQSVLVLDFGGQYNQLIARRVRECNVYCEVLPYTVSAGGDHGPLNPSASFLPAGPTASMPQDSPQVDPGIFQLGIPILGICYGCQLMAHHLGGEGRCQ